MLTFAAVVSGKSVAFFSRLLNIGGGSAAPGLYALKIDPALIQKLTGKIPKNIIITGTNGKTTTARMVAHMAKHAGLKVVRNHTGSNLERGIASALIQNSGFNLSGCRLNYDLGIWEVDEAAFNTLAGKINPDIIVFLNIFRDQLDRYGEIDTIVKNWRLTLEKLAPDTLILLNGDDHSLDQIRAGNILRFGVRNYLIRGETVKEKRTFKSLDLKALNVQLKDLQGSKFRVSKNKAIVTLPIPGIYHIYDALAALACVAQLGIPYKKAIESIRTFKPAFGRVEKINITPKGSNRKLPVYIFLIKNPAGASQVFQTIAPQIKKEDALLFALNDNLADGRDVSWIWDANFEVLLNPLGGQLKNPKVFVCGERAYDLATRIKYAGFAASNIKIEPDLKKTFILAQKGLEGRLFILPTYTAMLKFQKILAKSKIKRNYWEDDC